MDRKKWREERCPNEKRNSLCLCIYVVIKDYFLTTEAQSKQRRHREIRLKLISVCFASLDLLNKMFSLLDYFEQHYRWLRITA
jgi:hypothetical protein